MANIGTFDRILRLLLGAALVALPFLLAESVAALGAWRFALVGVGAVLIGTAIFRICPAYMLFGVRTCAIART